MTKTYENRGSTEEKTPYQELVGKKFPVLDKGYVVFVDSMPTTNLDQAIVQAARVSYGEGTKHISDDRKLIRYLMRHRHTTPLEMVELKFLIQMPMDAWRQQIRHRMASVNEYSTRYSEAIDEKQETPSNEWRLQSELNKQGSLGIVTEYPQDFDFNDVFDPSVTTPGKYLTDRETEFHEQATHLYEERLKFGVAREQARKDLPLSTYTRAYWKIDLHNLLHYLSLRMDAHAQQEIRAYGNVIGNEIVAKLCPLAWEAFCEYRLSAMSLSGLEIVFIGMFNEWRKEKGITYEAYKESHGPCTNEMFLCMQKNLLPDEWEAILKDPNDTSKGLYKENRERKEMVSKLERLGLV